MDEVTDLRNGAYWRTAVWGLRVMAAGLAVVVVGLVALAFSSGTGRTILAVGIVVYLVGVVVTVLGIALIYRAAPPPRPNFLDLRWSLLHDAVHVRSGSAEQRDGGTVPLGGPPAPSTHLRDLRHGAHWRPAVWGVRVMGLSLAVVIAGLVALAWSTDGGKMILAVGIGVYVVALVFTLVEVRRAYGDVRPPRPNRAQVHQTLLHDALHTRP